MVDFVEPTKSIILHVHVYVQEVMHNEIYMKQILRQMHTGSKINIRTFCIIMYLFLVGQYVLV